MMTPGSIFVSACAALVLLPGAFFLGRVLWRAGWAGRGAAMLFGLVVPLFIAAAAVVPGNGAGESPFMAYAMWGLLLCGVFTFGALYSVLAELFRRSSGL